MQEHAQRYGSSAVVPGLGPQEECEREVEVELEVEVEQQVRSSAHCVAQYRRLDTEVQFGQQVNRCFLMILSFRC